MTRYRLEWRDPADVAEAPDFSLCRFFDAGGEVMAAAAALAARGSAAHGEFHLALLDGRGSLIARVTTDRAALAAWDPGSAALPAMVTATRWEADIARSVAAVDAFETVRTSVRAAWRAGAVELTEAMRLVADAGRLLDADRDMEG